MGAGKWKPEHSEFLRGRRAVVVVDKDLVGRNHGQQVTRSLYGKAAEIKLVELPGPGKDATDWLEAGGTAKELLALVESTAAWEPAHTTDAPCDGVDHSGVDHGDADHDVDFIPANAEDCLRIINRVLRSKFGGLVEVVGVEKIGDTNGVYVLITRDGKRIVLGTAAKVLRVSAVREAIYDQTGILIGMNKNVWPAVANAISNLAKVKHIGNANDDVLAFLSQFVEEAVSNPRTRYCGGDEEPWSVEWRRAVLPDFKLGGYPRDCALKGQHGELLLNIQGFARWLFDHRVGVESGELKRALVALGFQSPQDVGAAGRLRVVLSDGKTLERKAWVHANWDWTNNTPAASGTGKSDLGGGHPGVGPTWAENPPPQPKS